MLIPSVSVCVCVGCVCMYVCVGGRLCVGGWMCTLSLVRSLISYLSSLISYHFLINTYRDAEEHELYHYHSPLGVRDPVTAPAAALGDERSDRADPTAGERGEGRGEMRGEVRGERE